MNSLIKDTEAALFFMVLKNFHQLFFRLAAFIESEDLLLWDYVVVLAVQEERGDSLADLGVNFQIV